MWKNGKEGNTEGRRIMEGKDGRREMIEADEKNGAKEKGGDAAGEGRGAAGQERKGERGAAGTSSGKQSGRKQNNCGMA